MSKENIEYQLEQTIVLSIYTVRFLIFYGSIRFIIEYFRQPDAHIGYLNSGMTMGQLLCVPMIFIGIILVLYFWKKNESLSRTS